MDKIKYLAVPLCLVLMNFSPVFAESATPTADQIQQWQKAAGQRDADAQYNLGIAYPFHISKIFSAPLPRLPYLEIGAARTTIPA